MPFGIFLNSIIRVQFRCQSVSSPLHRPFFCQQDFFPSPPKSYQLPSYGKGIGSQYIRLPVSPRHCQSTYDFGNVLHFLDIEAIESDSELSSFAYCSDNVSQSTSSSSNSFDESV